MSTISADKLEEEVESKSCIKLISVKLNSLRDSSRLIERAQSNSRLRKSTYIVIILSLNIVL